MSKISSDDPRPARGRKRQAELASEMKKAVEVNSKIMLAGLGRPHTLAEAFVAEAICALHLKARRLRDSGRDDVAVLVEAARLQQGSVFAAPYSTPLPLIDPAIDREASAPSVESHTGRHCEPYAEHYCEPYTERVRASDA